MSKSLLERWTSMVAAACLFLAACNPLGSTQRFTKNYSFSSADGKPDYGSLSYWAAHPRKWDPSDSVPQPLRASYQPDSAVDVFFLHPTTYTTEGHPLGLNGPVDNPELNAATDYRPILYQASCFNEYRVFAPRYRQAHLSNYYSSDSVAASRSFALAYADVKQAFLHYLKHENKGRPFIIASHSQGTTHGRLLLKELADGKPLARQLVAAYLVGIPVPLQYYQALKPCASPASTGCVVSWRTMQTGYLTSFAQAERVDMMVTNPLSFDAAIPASPKEANKGLLMPNFNKLLSGRVNAAVHNNVLWADKPSIVGSSFLKKDYHVADFNFYWLNVRENLRERVAAWKRANGS